MGCDYDCDDSYVAVPALRPANRPWSSLEIFLSLKACAADELDEEEARSASQRSGLVS